MLGEDADDTQSTPPSRRTALCRVKPELVSIHVMALMPRGGSGLLSMVLNRAVLLWRGDYVCQC